jgi:hypothetical protein
MRTLACAELPAATPGPPSLLPMSDRGRSLTQDGVLDQATQQASPRQLAERTFEVAMRSVRRNRVGEPALTQLGQDTNARPLSRITVRISSAE